ncbi:MAG TPA: class I SAM-dependent methyltransferase [Verrucomicrobiota bacterium]|nr:class I SAM-dependent methyltransferase [Verrucomicrobiota bacterium]
MNSWRPPSDCLDLVDGIWQAKAISPVYYPEDGNETCLQVEETSYWFNHRNQCIIEVLRQFPPGGRFYDIGGGNGFVAKALQQAGIDVVLVEPGQGAFNALQRGVKKVVRATLHDAMFRTGSIPALGAFDVLEHIEDEARFLSEVRRVLKPGGRFYCTVPAMPSLWSHEDIQAGHFRRYSVKTLAQLLKGVGFITEFITYIFTWLVFAVLLLRTLPSRLGQPSAQCRNAILNTKAAHQLPLPFAGAVERVHNWELSRLHSRRSIPLGTSILAVATRIL